MFSSSSFPVPDLSNSSFRVPSSIADEGLGAIELSTAPYRTDYPFPVVGISTASLRSILSCLSNATARNESLLATINSAGDPSPWRVISMSASWWFFSIFTAASSCLLGAFAFVRLRDHFLAQKSLLVGVPQAVLYLELLGCACM
jgi:hypothetical protein